MCCRRMRFAHSRRRSVYDSCGNRWPCRRGQVVLVVGVKLDSRRAARGGGLVLNEKEEIIGVVTTGAYCPTLDKAAALCSIDLECAVKPGDRVLLEAGAAKLPGTVEKLPFHHAGTVREKLTC